MNRLKDFLKDFPNQNGAVVAALFLILVTGLIVAVRLARGLFFPDGYEAWLLFLATLAGVNTIGMIGKRATDIEYKRAATPSPVTVEAPSTVRVNSSPTPTQDVPSSVSIEGAPATPMPNGVGSAPVVAEDATPNKTRDD